MMKLKYLVFATDDEAEESGVCHRCWTRRFTVLFLVFTTDNELEDFSLWCLPPKSKTLSGVYHRRLTRRCWCLPTIFGIEDYLVLLSTDFPLGA
jgi:hypothetical protein